MQYTRLLKQSKNIMITVDTDAMLAKAVEDYYQLEEYEMMCSNDDCGEWFTYNDDDVYADKCDKVTVVDCSCCGHQNIL